MTTHAKFARCKRISYALLALFLVGIACGVPGASPSDPAVQEPTVVEGLTFQGYLGMIRAIQRPDAILPWIVSPIPPPQGGGTVSFSGWGPNQTDMKGNEPPAIVLHEVFPNGCGKGFTLGRELGETTINGDEHRWYVPDIQLPPDVTIVGAVVVADGREGPLGNLLVFNTERLKPKITKPQVGEALLISADFSGEAFRGICITLWRDDQILGQTSADSNGNWGIKSVSLLPGDNRFELRLERFKDLEPIRYTFQGPALPRCSPWDTSWLPNEKQDVVKSINLLLEGTGLSGQGGTILNLAIEYQVNPAFALAMFRKEASFAAKVTPAYPKGTPAYLNNNPGNINATGDCRGQPNNTACKGLYGEISTNGRFGKYATMADGIKAYFMLLSSEYGAGSKRNCQDISCIISAYAPPSENDTPKYIQEVTDWTRQYQYEILAKAELVNALKDLRDAMLKKIDSDVDVTATAFTDVKDYWRTKRWADIFTAPLRVLQGTLSLLSKAADIKSLAQETTKALDGSEAAYQVLGMMMMYQGLQEAGEKLHYGLDGPTYVSSIESMLEAADATTVPPLGFSREYYQKVIENHLYGTAEDTPVIIPRQSTTPARKKVEFASGVLEVRSSIARTFNDLIAEVEGRELPAGFPLDETIAQLKELKQQITKSMSYGADVRYPAYLGGKTAPEDTKLGAVGELYGAFGEVAGRVDKKLQIEQRMEVLKLLETAESAALLYTVTYKIPGAEEIRIAQKVTTLAGVITKSYANTFYADPEKQFYMIPQEMLLSLPTELSNLWMIADDTSQYLHYLLGLE